MTDKIISFSKETVDGETVTKTSIVRRNNDRSWSGSYIINNGEPQSMTPGEVRQFLEDTSESPMTGPVPPPSQRSGTSNETPGSSEPGISDLLGLLLGGPELPPQSGRIHSLGC